MASHRIARPGRLRAGRRLFVVPALAIASLSFCTCATAAAQTRTVRDTATAYGARLNAKGEPANLNPARINNRINSRLDTRLSLRIERYRPDSVADPTAAFAVKSTDNARIGTQATLAPLAASSEGDTGSSSPTSSQPTNNSTTIQPR